MSVSVSSSSSSSSSRDVEVETTTTIPLEVSLSSDAPGHSDGGEGGPVCWKCRGSGRITKKKNATCPVCRGRGRLKRKRKEMLGKTRPGVITKMSRGKDGWVRPGPRPPMSKRADLLPQHGEELCCLVGYWRIFQRVGGHRYSTEDVVTAWSAGRLVSRCERDSKKYVLRHYVDMGTGIGSVLQMVTWQLMTNACRSKHVVRCMGVEAQKQSLDMARRSVAYNGCDETCSVVRGDLRELSPDASMLPEHFVGKKAQLVTGTPPYFKIRFDNDESRPRAECVQGSLPSCAQSAPARCEFRGGIESYCLAASKILDETCPMSRFVVCEGGLHTNRTRVVSGARSAGLHIVSRIDVVPKVGKPVLFSVYEMSLRPNAKPLMMENGGAVVKTIVVRGRDNKRTGAYCSLLREMGMPT